MYIEIIFTVVLHKLEICFRVMLKISSCENGRKKVKSEFLKDSFLGAMKKD